jgi:hypothetical protein
MEVVKGFLPKKKEKGKPTSPEEVGQKVRPTKIVTPIKKKKGGKK